MKKRICSWEALCFEPGIEERCNTGLAHLGSRAGWFCADHAEQIDAWEDAEIDAITEAEGK